MEMVEAGKSCKEVLRQLHAVQSALQAAGTLLIACQARESEAIIRENPDPDERAAELVRLRGFFMELTHYANPNREVNP